MSVEVIHDAPSLDSFTPLAVHQSQTPDSFFTGNPVLHYHARRARAILPNGQTALQNIFVRESGVTADTTVNGHASPSGAAHQTLSDVDIFVTSEYVLPTLARLELKNLARRLILFQPSTSKGISIAYPNISLHAIQRLEDSDSDSGSQRQGLYMQIGNGAEGYEDDESTTELTVVPDSSSGTGDIQDLYTAVSACSNLHPDPATGSDDDENLLDNDNVMFEGSVGYASGIVLPGNHTGDGGLPPPFPGSGGWITAENVAEHFDENGNWRSGLGPGAGTVRQRSDGDAEEQIRTDERTDDAEPRDHDETKWRRTE